MHWLHFKQREHFPCISLATFALAGALAYCISVFFGPACRANYVQGPSNSNQCKSFLSSAQTDSKLSEQNDRCTFFTKDCWLALSVYCYFVGKNIAFPQQQQMVLKALATWVCLQQIIVCWIRHKYLLLSFNCSCLFFSHLQNMAVCQNRHKFLGFCVKSVYCLNVAFDLFCLYFSSSGQLGGITISVFCFALGSVLSSLLRFVEGRLLK